MDPIHDSNSDCGLDQTEKTYELSNIWWTRTTTWISECLDFNRVFFLGSPIQSTKKRGNYCGPTQKGDLTQKRGFLTRKTGDSTNKFGCFCWRKCHSSTLAGGLHRMWRRQQGPRTSQRCGAETQRRGAGKRENHRVKWCEMVDLNSQNQAFTKKHRGLSDINGNFYGISGFHWIDIRNISLHQWIFHGLDIPLIWLIHHIWSGWWFGTWTLFFHSVGNVITPTDELHHFSEG